MKESNKTTKFLRKALGTKPLNSVAFNGTQLRKKYNNSCFDENEIVCVILKSAKGHHNRLYDSEDQNRHGQKPKKIGRKLQEDNVEASKIIRFSLKILSTI